MKKFFLTIILLIIISILYIYTKNINKESIIVLDNSITTEVKNDKVTQANVPIYLYDPSQRVLIQKEFNFNSKTELDQLVKTIIRNSKYLKKDMKMLAIYELPSGDILIKLNSEFKNLTKESFEGFKDSITKSIKSINKDIKEIKFELD